MTEEIRIYVEGGGDCTAGRSSIRQGFGAFLGSLRNQARSKGIRWNVIASGTRNSCYDDFCTALRTHPDAFNVLLVDSEGPVLDQGPLHYLSQHDGWSVPALDEHCHLMAQMMEAWLIADRDTLKNYYGQGFLNSAIPKNADVEQIDKATLESALDNATRNTQKGKYHRIRHGADLLQRVDPDVVRRKARHCERLFRALGGLM